MHEGIALISIIRSKCQFFSSSEGPFDKANKNCDYIPRTQSLDRALQSVLRKKNVFLLLKSNLAYILQRLGKASKIVKIELTH
jgi:hypothetical protein